ncbi:hypothetical protein L1987_81724 [Smallanthus sonchifolius]|uniref:Uncharacterized protein n=1 Tax=Smallanthus sonchifolius TaxID=185202 RepID=A0ACB8YRI1_9ASTR|nr:hypothetical protein L1987_81724 [Smallanthus sonchifolius]
MQRSVECLRLMDHGAVEVLQTEPSEEHFYQSRFLPRSQVMEHPSLSLRKPVIAVSIHYVYESKMHYCSSVSNVNGDGVGFEDVSIVATQIGLQLAEGPKKRARLGFFGVRFWE